MFGLLTSICVLTFIIFRQCNDDVPPAMDFAKKRLQLAESLYYKVLENVMRNERKRLQAKEPKNCDLSVSADY